MDGFSKGWAGLSAAGSRHSSILSKSPMSDISAATAAVLHAGDAAVAVLHAWDAAVAALHAEDAVVAVLQAGDAVMASSHAAAGTVSVSVKLLIQLFAFRLFP